MSIYLGSSEPSKIYVGSNEVAAVYVGDKQVRPSIIEYDFTTGNHGWTASSGLTRDSNGFYSTGTMSEQYILAPSEIFNHGNPKKITISYNKTGTSSGTGLGVSNYSYGYFVSGRDYQLKHFFNIVNGSITDINMGINPTGVGKWILEINSSTTNWTVTHKITGVSDIVESNGALKNVFTGKYLKIRIVNWNSGSGMKIKGAKFEY